MVEDFGQKEEEDYSHSYWRHLSSIQFSLGFWRVLSRRISVAFLSLVLPACVVVMADGGGSRRRLKRSR
nr:hypothetical protein Iba_chr03bCG3500 [Ipomoea batatas]